MKNFTAAAVLVLVLCAGSVGRAAVGTLADFNGQVAAWGYNTSGQTTVPAGNNFVAIAGGAAHSLALYAF